MGNILTRKWTAKLVKRALINAQLTLQDTVGRVGPSKVRSAALAYSYSAEDIWEQRRTGENKKGRMKSKRQWSSIDISHSDLVLFGGRIPNGKNTKAWLNGALLGYKTYREKLMFSTEFEVAKETGRTRRPIKDICRNKNWPYNTFRWQRDRAAQIIADHLNYIGLEPWD